MRHTWVTALGAFEASAGSISSNKCLKRRWNWCNQAGEGQCEIYSCLAAFQQNSWRRVRNIGVFASWRIRTDTISRLTVTHVSGIPSFREERNPNGLRTSAKIGQVVAISTSSRRFHAALFLKFPSIFLSFCILCFFLFKLVPFSSFFFKW